jgi:hypothetical protein
MERSGAWAAGLVPRIADDSGVSRYVTENDFQLRVVRELGELSSDLQGVNARLDKINGSVARHERSINETTLTLQSHVISSDSRNKESAAWSARVVPWIERAIWLALCGLVGHEQILKLLKP